MPERLTILLATLLGLGIGVGWYKVRIRRLERGREEKVGAKQIKPKKVVSKGRNDVEERIISALERTKRGASLSDLGRKLKVHFLKLMFPLKQLTDEGRVVKEGKVYKLAIINN